MLRSNYGDGSFVMDKIFGTFRDSLEKPAKVIADDGIAYERFDDDRAMTGAQQRKKPHPSKPRSRRRKGGPWSLSLVVYTVPI